MSPFTALVGLGVALLVVRSVVGFYREREVFARYDARVRLAAQSRTSEDSAASGDVSEADVSAARPAA